ncbi:hypothetical protein CFP65_6115 [Kitasatospora sp. MMS16-BH015]|uniref:hypothetical protein n=1 Tax=Kitasatospora sp. MMS16-BH015 TaxID=2018025 RepID=UPI000CA3841F|nr:hypothetical protein [Kitasatospora sp. MMS16-BH015]AUG80783.1 hypothetical protein CFP65_6115 [Kitasatospora sp. MMS16-BH015]
MSGRRTIPLLGALTLTGLALAAPVTPAAACPRAACVSYGPAVALGAGAARSYAVWDGERPLALGLALTPGALDHLPTVANDGHHCYDLDGDGRIDPVHECSDGHEHVLDLPPGAPAPYSWLLLNWNPLGHGPPMVYDWAHFDVHFYLQAKAERDAIRPGPCQVLVDCADQATATEPVPPEYLPPGYEDRHLVEPAMGNHLVDPAGPEWRGGPFTRTFIYGAYGGAITFLEPMITVAELRSPATDCTAVKRPAGWQRPGWYPDRYCLRHHPATGEYTVSLEGFRHS